MKTKKKKDLKYSEVIKMIDEFDKKYLDNDYSDYLKIEHLQKGCDSKFSICSQIRFIIETFLLFEVDYKYSLTEKTYGKITNYFIKKHLKEDFDKKPYLIEEDIYVFVDSFLQYEYNLPNELSKISNDWLKNQFEFYFNSVMINNYKIDFETTMIKYNNESISVKECIWKTLNDLENKIFKK